MPTERSEELPRDLEALWAEIAFAAAHGEPPTIQRSMTDPPRAIMVDPRLAAALLDLRTRIDRLSAPPQREETP